MDFNKRKLQREHINKRDSNIHTYMHNNTHRHTKIAQIGVGGWGRHHTRVLAQMGMLCAVCDSNATRHQEYAKKYPTASHHTSVVEMLESVDFDGAIVATPTATHTEIAKMLLEAGKHVFVEKPLSYNAKDGAMLAKLADRKSLVLTCGYIERFNPAVNTLKKIIENKTYGNPIIIEFHRENRMPLHIMDVGIIHDTAVHDIDTANWLFDCMPNVVFAIAGSMVHKYEDFANIMLGYGEGKTATISSNWITPKRTRRLEMVCTEAVVSLDFIEQTVIIQKQNTITQEYVQKQEPLYLEIQNFIDAIADKNKQIVTARQASHVTEIAEAALLSSSKGVPIYLDFR